MNDLKLLAPWQRSYKPKAKHQVTWSLFRLLGAWLLAIVIMVAILHQFIQAIDTEARMDERKKMRLQISKDIVEKSEYQTRVKLENIIKEERGKQNDK